MIDFIQISNLRGIRSGRLEGLTPLTVLTGPNGCGKSAVLDALLICGGKDTGQAIGEAVARHPVTPDGARWLINFGQTAASVVARSAGQVHRWDLTGGGVGASEKDSKELTAHQARFPFRQLTCTNDGKYHSTVVFSFDNQFLVRDENRYDSTPGTRLIDPSIAKPLARDFSEAFRHGRHAEINDFLRPLVDGLIEIGILAEEDGVTPQLYLHKEGGSRPVGLSGDGIQALIHIAVELASLPTGSLALIEEPEVFSHPRSLRQVARALVLAVDRGVQIVLTTHSLELIDALIVALGKKKLGQLSLFNLALMDGDLKHGYSSGEDVWAARQELESDLR